VENDFGTFLREEAGHRGADPGGATGDEDDLILKSHNYFAFPFFGGSSFFGLAAASGFD
jgi:hypothetical protein